MIRLAASEKEAVKDKTTDGTMLITRGGISAFRTPFFDNLLISSGVRRPVFRVVPKIVYRRIVAGPLSRNELSP